MGHNQKGDRQKQNKSYWRSERSCSHVVSNLHYY